MLGGDQNGLAFRDWAFICWRDRYGTKAPWLPKDFVILARALAAFEDEATARAAWTAFLDSQDPFYAGHEPGKFLVSLSRWGAKAKPRPSRKPSEDDVRTVALIRIHREVSQDPNIPESGKRDECSRRYREIFP